MRKRIPYRFPTSLLRLTLLFAAAASSGTAFGQLSALASEPPKPPEEGIMIGPEGPVAPPPRPGQPAPTRGPQQIKLTISPAAEPVPALKYRFDVPLLQQKPGNSTTFYYRALVQLGEESSEQRREFDDFHTAFHSVPLDEFPIEKAREILARYRNVFTELSRATDRETTDWNWRMGELSGPEAIAFRLNEIQEARHFARMLQLKARLEIAEGRFDDAEKTLRMGYALARAVAEQPTIINALVGIAIASVMDTAVLDWIGKQGSPNVYWALATLPDPLVDMRQPLEYDLSFAFRFAPWMEHAASDDAPPAVWRERFAKLIAELNDLGELIGGPLQPSHAVLTGLALRSYPMAKRALVEEQGFAAEDVEAMPVGKVLAIRQKYVDELIAHEILKVELVPSEIAADIGDRVQESLKERSLLHRPGLGREAVPLMALLAPASQQASRAEARLTTKFAALKAIEAIRMHTATTGALPKSLDEINVVPVPENPLTGEPFPYRVEGGTAILEVVVETHFDTANWHVELTLNK